MWLSSRSSILGTRKQKKTEQLWQDAETNAHITTLWGEHDCSFGRTELVSKFCIYRTSMRNNPWDQWSFPSSLSGVRSLDLSSIMLYISFRNSSIATDRVCVNRNHIPQFFNILKSSCVKKICKVRRYSIYTCQQVVFSSPSIFKFFIKEM